MNDFPALLHALHVLVLLCAGATVSLAGVCLALGWVLDRDTRP